MKLIVLFFISFTLLAIPSLKEINNEFNLVSKKYNIPAPLLKALAYKQSSWNINFGKDDEINKDMYGIMGLYQDKRVSSIQNGAKLLNLDEIYGIINYKWNIEMSAKIISEIRNDYINTGENIKNIEDYFSIMVDYLDYPISLRELSENLTIKIFKLINTGYTIKYKNELLNIKGVNVNVSELKTNNLNKLYLNYNDINSLEGIEFISSPNYYNGRGGYTIDQIIIHIMQGYFEGTISYFKKTSSEVSAHYLVSQDGELIQMVKLSDRAWHAGNHNNRSIGIEHAGFDGASYHSDQYITEEEYQASAKLVKWLTERYNIPRIHRDAYHDENGNFVPWHLQRPELSDLPGILGHHDCNGKEFCPGPHWNWSHYMELLGTSSNLTGEITIISPKPNEVVDNPVIFKCKVDGDIKKIKYFADDTYLLGESSNKDNDFKIEYNFTGIGTRKISFKGYDENDNLIYSSIKTHEIEIIEAGEGTVIFKTPLDNTESVNPVILETNVTGDIAKVKYFAENTIFLGESTNKNNNFQVTRVFNQSGNRVLQAKGYNSDDILISDAEDEVHVNVPKIDSTVIEECIPECNNNKETKCNINGNVNICMPIDNCLIWQTYQECGGDEYCNNGKCIRREIKRECKDECSFVGQKECMANSAILTCRLDKNNCLKFYLEETCQDGFICQVGKCIDKTKAINNESSNEGCSFSSRSNKNNIIFLFLAILFALSLKNKLKN